MQTCKLITYRINLVGEVVFYKLKKNIRVIQYIATTFKHTETVDYPILESGYKQLTDNKGLLMSIMSK